MNKQSLYVFGGSLLATTALSTAGHAAALIKANPGLGGVVSSAAITPKALATQLFSATLSTANAQTFGSTTTAVGDLLIDFALPITLPFRVQLDIVNASFTGSPGILSYTQTTAGTASLAAGSVTGCTVQTQPDRILIVGCDQTGQTQFSRVDAVAITGIRYTAAAALATASQSITISGFIKDATATSTFDTITSAAVVTSKSAIDAGITAGGNVTVDSTVSPAFSKLVAATALSVTTANLGSTKYSATSAVGTDLSFAFLATSIGSVAEVKVTHGVLLDDALTTIQYVGSGPGAQTVTRVPSQFVSNVVSFQVAGASLDSSSIVVTFDGSTLIDATSGTASVTVTPTPATATGGGALITLASFSGTLAAFSRGGLSVELNTLQPTAGVGSTLYRSFLRISNTSPLNGVATITVRDDITGATLGSFSTASMTTAITAGLLSATGEIRGNSTLQLSAGDIEALTTGAAATGHPYKVIVSGSFNGYVQNVMWNSVTGIFTDLSGFRNGVLSLDP